jgi:hypothetical protein
MLPPWASASGRWEPVEEGSYRLSDYRICLRSLAVSSVSGWFFNLLNRFIKFIKMAQLQERLLP